MLLDLLNIKAWAMESRFFERAYPIALELITNGQDLSKLKALNPEAAVFPTAKNRDQNSGFPVFKAANGKNVGVMRIAGGLTKTGDMCSYGSRDYARWIERADASEGIDALVIEMDTPGGSVDGTPELGLAIKETNVPLVVFADNMVASAGIWAASQANKIMANANNYTEIGSIGTLYVHGSYANVIEAGNFPNVKIIRAPQSVDKAKVNSFEELTADQENAIKADLKQITEDFIATVKAGRGDRLNTGEENIFTGKMYPAVEALAMGLIDSIGSRQDAIDRAGELAANTKTQITVAAGSANSNTNMKLSDFKALFSGKADKGVNDEKSLKEAFAQLSEDDQAVMLAATGALTERDDRITELEGEVSVLTSEKSGLEATITEKESNIAEHDATITAHVATIAAQKAELDKAADGHQTTVIPKKNEFGKGAKSFETDVDKEAREMQAQLNGEEAEEK